MPHRLPPIPALDEACAERVAGYIDTLTKPPGSLGRVERLAIELAAMTGDDFPVVAPPAVVVFAADHGVAAEGVSAFPQTVTAQMVANFVAGGAAINVFARQMLARLEVVDVGMATSLSAEGVVIDRVRPGTANLALEDAMTRDEAWAAIRVGRRAAERAASNGCRCLIAGEMGIANTTPSTAMLAALTGIDVGELVGPGTGVAGPALAHKQAVIEAAMVDRLFDAEDPVDVLATLGGLEIAAMAGAYLEAASRRMPVIVDGFIATVAALAACRMLPELRPFLIFGHRSHEPGHAHALAALDAEPLLAMELCLGEGTGAALAFPLLQAATAMLSRMATFDTAGIDDREGAEPI
ncbi:nicotinate-nucleotide--dimethylbenzimidazole phosphoribosyltransferase [Halomonas halmophila]|uniref:Nicotinate-nucleotide--dimethylbenzimidazole phosphoribosyltransferase n=1 Tax=Halomonas halmophila TaxID=252 RepID=A0A4Y4EYB9_9GAMM|nr:nicotinate-nucleotide--dimethylbenzimidazole phosphoribosyltransferase [Halomonas halmophila]GED22073.1 nicotinate-nucleotide--dimethylbenzimidazole phosphoribosyltransferase [Halomonas halmophila]